MNLQESVSIIRQIERYYPSFKPDEETVKAWAAELYQCFEKHDAKWVWGKIHNAIIDDGGTFTPSLPWVCDKIYAGVREITRANKYNEQQIAPPEEKVSESVLEENLRKVREILAEANRKAAENKEEGVLNMRDMRERRVHGKVLTDEERAEARVEIHVNPEKEEELLDLYKRHTGNDGILPVKKMLRGKRKRT